MKLSKLYLCNKIYGIEINIYIHDYKHLYYSQQEWWKLISNPNKLCKETDYCCVHKPTIYI